MIIRDEAGNLPRSLQPLRHLLDQMIVLDTGSGDGSAALAKRLGAQVYDFVWQDDFALARNRAIELASADWLLWLDADNGLVRPEEDITVIRSLLSPEPAIIWATERVTRSGELLEQKRIFPRRPEARFAGRIHEQLVHPPHWPQRRSRVVIDHWGYQNPEQLRQKGIYYLGLIRQSLEENPDDYYSRYQAARCYFNLRRFPEAAQQLALALTNPALRRENPALLVQAGLLRATALERLSDRPGCDRQLEQLMAGYPENPLPPLAAGRLAYLAGEYERAADLLEKSLGLNLDTPMIDLNPKQCRFSACYLLGLALSKLGRPAAAALALERALDIDPDHRGARLDRAEICWNLGRHACARQQLTQVLNKYPQDGRAGRLARKWSDHA
jgi:tetratricopeptide (TPR) repeat protein